MAQTYVPLGIPSQIGPNAHSAGICYFCSSKHCKASSCTKQERKEEASRRRIQHPRRRRCSALRIPSCSWIPNSIHRCLSISTKLKKIFLSPTCGGTNQVESTSQDMEFASGNFVFCPVACTFGRLCEHLRNFCLNLNTFMATACTGFM